LSRGSRLRSDICVTLARTAERTKRFKFGASVLIPSDRHPMAQASAIATLEQIAPVRRATFIAIEDPNRCLSY